jgi:hypothetical protein
MQKIYLILILLIFLLFVFNSGVLPQFQEAWEFIQSQKETQYSDLKQACELVDSQAHSLCHRVKWYELQKKKKKKK